MFAVRAVWRLGRARLLARPRHSTVPLADFLESLFLEPVHRVPGTAVFISRDTESVPSAFLHNLAHNKVLHACVIFVAVRVAEVPNVALAEQTELVPLGEGCWRATVTWGFKDAADLPRSLRAIPGADLDPMTTSYFISREILLLSPAPGMARWRKRFYLAMFRLAGNSAEHYGLPPNRVVELGAQIEF
jgi:KUP system potassium uptake protein